MADGWPKYKLFAGEELIKTNTIVGVESRRAGGAAGRLRLAWAARSSRQAAQRAALWRDTENRYVMLRCAVCAIRRRETTCWPANRHQELD